MKPSTIMVLAGVVGFSLFWKSSGIAAISLVVMLCGAVGVAWRWSKAWEEEDERRKRLK